MIMILIPYSSFGQSITNSVVTKDGVFAIQSRPYAEVAKAINSWTCNVRVTNTARPTSKLGVKNSAVTNAVITFQATFYFAVAPAVNAPDYNAGLSNIVKGMKNPSQSPVMLIPSGGTTSATNSFASQAQTNGSTISCGVDIVSMGPPFTFTNITWVLSTPYWAFTNVWVGWRFGPGFAGNDGKVSYADGLSADGVPLTEVWVARQGWEYLLNQGDTTDKALSSFDATFSPNMPMTLSFSVGGVGASGTVSILVNPPLYVKATKNVVQVSWPEMYPTWPFILESKPSLSATNWTTVPGVPGYMDNPQGSRNFINITNTTSGNGFLRLRYGN